MLLRSPTAPTLSRLITKRALAKPLGCSACEPLPRYALRNLSVIDASLLDGFTPQNHTILGFEDHLGWKRLRLGTT
ncbi:MAG: hypothetical protein P4L59_05960 [Desulfosporosinus sp.]|nr:hypothetical protein [Desulfosporosinus sp.]